VRGADRTPSPYKSLLLKGPKFLPQSPTKKKDQENAVKAFHPGKTAALFAVLLLSNRKLTLNFQAVATGSGVSWHEKNQDEHVLSKADGKKRAIDEDEEGTATEGEASHSGNLPKKKKKENK